MKISQLCSNASKKFSFIKKIKAVVNPHPGQLTPNTDFHRQGIQMVIPVIAFSKAEKTK